MKARFSIMKHSYLRVGIGGILLALAIGIFFSNARLSEEFTGWVKITVAGQLHEEKVHQDIQTYFQQKWLVNASMSLENQWENTKVSLKTEVKKDEEVNVLSKEIQQLLIEKKHIASADQILEQSITGPSVGNYMQKSARSAIIVGLILMAIYMLFSFATIRKYIAPWVLATVVIVTMIFDVWVPAWAYGIWMWLDKTVMIDSVFIIALLTNMGYSINDTIIIFDRIRENVQNKWNTKWALFGKIFEQSVWQTMRRSFGTVFSTFLVILAMFILGTGVIKQFAFTIGMWVIFGSYSSIFISAPLAYILLGKYRKERKQMLTLKKEEL